MHSQKHLASPCYSKGTISSTRTSSLHCQPNIDAIRRSRVAKKLKLQERRAVIPSRRSLAACRPLGFLGRLRAPSRIGGHTRGTYGVGTYPGLHHWDGGP